MAQQNWHLHNGIGREHIIGIYHGDDSGHLVVHLNNQVLILDFSVMQSRTYKFFIDQELYQLNIDKEGDGFSYNLAVDYEADTHLNRERNSEKKEERLAYILSICVAVLIFVVSIGLAYYFKE